MAIMLQRRPTPLPAWHLQDQAALLTALDELRPHGYRGALMSDPDAGTWRVELNIGTNITVSAVIGDWLILDGGLKVMSEASQSADYEAAD